METTSRAHLETALKTAHGAFNMPVDRCPLEFVSPLRAREDLVLASVPGTDNLRVEVLREVRHARGRYGSFTNTYFLETLYINKPELGWLPCLSITHSPTDRRISQTSDEFIVKALKLLAEVV